LSIGWIFHLFGWILPTHPDELLTQSLNNTDNSLFLRINPNQINFAKQKAQSS
jgi:hypothetical protein